MHQNCPSPVEFSNFDINRYSQYSERVPTSTFSLLKGFVFSSFSIDDYLSVKALVVAINKGKVLVWFLLGILWISMYKKLSNWTTPLVPQHLCISEPPVSVLVDWLTLVSRTSAEAGQWPPAGAGPGWWHQSTDWILSTLAAGIQDTNLISEEYKPESNGC